jgi:hypothetical protein
MYFSNFSWIQSSRSRLAVYGKKTRLILRLNRALTLWQALNLLRKIQNRADTAQICWTPHPFPDATTFLYWTPDGQVAEIVRAPSGRHGQLDCGSSRLHVSRCQRVAALPNPEKASLLLLPSHTENGELSTLTVSKLASPSYRPRRSRGGGGRQRTRKGASFFSPSCSLQSLASRSVVNVALTFRPLLHICPPPLPSHPSLFCWWFLAAIGAVRAPWRR